jgi:hypothetical protein
MPADASRSVDARVRSGNVRAQIADETRTNQRHRHHQKATIAAAANTPLT